MLFLETIHPQDRCSEFSSRTGKGFFVVWSGLSKPFGKFGKVSRMSNTVEKRSCARPTAAGVPRLAGGSVKGPWMTHSRSTRRPFGRRELFTVCFILWILFLFPGEAHGITPGSNTMTKFFTDDEAADFLKKHRNLVAANYSALLGMDDEELGAYSIVRAIKQLANGERLDGLEKQASDATAKLCKREPKGFFIPQDVMISHSPRAALNQTTGTQGNFLTGTSVLTDSLIEILRNKTLISQMGARTLGGLVGNVAIPRVVGGATAYWLNESGTVTESDQSFGQLGLVPKRLVGDTAFQKELVFQTSADVEGFVREDLMRVLAIEKDRAAFFGTGGSQPLGMFNTTGIGSTTFGGAATWAKILDFETQVANANADQGRLGYITNPTVRAKWKAITKIAASSYSDFLWEGGGIVNGYPAGATNQIPTTGTFANRVVFANFADVILADWAGIDVVVDPYTLKKQGQIEVTVTLWTDFGIRHVGSICVSSDTGAA